AQQSSLTTFHEYFHALQDMQDGRADGVAFVDLDKADAIFCSLLMEAGAVGYELMCKKEADNRGIELRPVLAEPVYMKGGMILGYRVPGSCSGESDVQAAFDKAYAVEWKNGAHLNPVTRE